MHIVGSRFDADQDADGEDLSTGQQTLTVDYSRLVTVLWTVVQDNRQRIAALEARLAANESA